MVLLKSGAVAYDCVHRFWEDPKVSRRVSVLLVFLFIAAGMLTLGKKIGILPPALDAIIPSNSFFAINLAFAFILGLEVIELIFAVADSLSRAVGKQLEIMALLLLRDIFKDIGHINSAQDFIENYFLLGEVSALAIGALLLFLCLGAYMKLQPGKRYITNEADKEQYVASKKCVALLLFGVFVGFGLYDLYTIFIYKAPSTFFLYFYSILIFSDILLVLVAQCYMPSFHATFRNSGYAVGTLIMRIALGVSPIWTAALSVFAGLYVIGLTWATSRYLPPVKKEHEVATSGLTGTDSVIAGSVITDLASTDLASTDLASNSPASNEKKDSI